MAIEPVGGTCRSAAAAGAAAAADPDGELIAALRAAERYTVGLATEGLCVIDNGGRLAYVSGRFAELLGTDAAALSGHRAAALTFDHGASAGFTAHLARADGTAFAWCVRRADGSPLWTDARVKPNVDAAGVRVSVLCTVSDASVVRAGHAQRDRGERDRRALAETIEHPVFTTDARGRFEGGNRAWYAYTGWDAAGANRWPSIIHPDDAAETWHAFAVAHRAGVPLRVQIRLRRAADGAYRWFDGNATPVFDGGTLTGWIGSATDVHDQRIETETRDVLDTLGHMISIRDGDGRLEYVSRSWREFTGDELTWREPGRQAVHPDDLKISQQLAQSSLAAAGELMQAELRIRAADGTYHWFLVRTVILPGPSRRIYTLTNIDELKRVQAAFGYSEQRYRALTDAMPQLIWIVDACGALEYVNERWTTYTGLALASDPAPTSASVVHPDDLATLIAKHHQSAANDDECEVRIRRHDGVFRWHLVRTVPLGDDAAGASKRIVTATDIEARKAAEAALADSAAELTRRAHHDILTDLPNRMKLLEELDEIIARSKRDGGEIVVLYLDVDHFKAINDTVGHQSGDRLLMETAARISSTLRGDDVASRFGGDEFVIVCAWAGADDAAAIAERLAAAVRTPIDLHGRKVTVSSSIGISVYPRDGSSAAELVQKADSALYEAKENGRNTWCMYNAQTPGPAIPALEFETELREAIALDQFVVHYQPIIDVETGRTVGAEALVRWAHPVRGLLGPGDFISFAEHHGLIAPIGDLVLRAACEELRRLRLRPSDEFSIAVNVSARQFQKAGFVSTIADAIEAFGLDARRLEIEITESIVMCDTQAVIATLDKLEALGVKLSLDDFGTGYSSLAYIKNFPIHTLKIDRSFVSDIAINFTDQAIAKTIVTLAHSLGMRVIAEGVETGEQLELLRSFGADCIQGFFISKPLAGPQFEDFMAGRGTAALAD